MMRKQHDTCKDCGQSIHRGGGGRGKQVMFCLVCETARIMQTLPKKGKAQR